MKYVAYLLVALTAFWSGIVVEMARRPPQVVYVVKAEPPPAKIENCLEKSRQCFAQQRANKTRGM